MRLMFIAILMILLALPCYAFEPDRHELFSQQAASVYRTCTGSTIQKELISAFAKGAADEDNPGLTRAINWHFYNNGKKIGNYWKFILYCHGSNEHIFLERLNELENMLMAKKPLPEIYAVAGRIVHHIQDMSSPPHVAPIYHVFDDRFDIYASVNLPVFDNLTICKDVKENIHKPSELLEQAAQLTLKAIDSPVAFDNGKTIEGETWRKFWGGPEDENLSGFRTYGEYGNAFGEVPPCKNEVCSAYNKSVYDKFYNDCYTRAVADTVRLLIYLDKRIKH